MSIVYALMPVAHRLLKKVKTGKQTIINWKSREIKLKAASNSVTAKAAIERKAKLIAKEIQWGEPAFRPAAAICNVDGIKQSSSKAVFRKTFLPCLM